MCICMCVYFRCQCISQLGLLWAFNTIVWIKKKTDVEKEYCFILIGMLLQNS